jgi:hypothetical protein
MEAVCPSEPHPSHPLAPSNPSNHPTRSRPNQSSLYRAAAHGDFSLSTARRRRRGGEGEAGGEENREAAVGKLDVVSPLDPLVTVRPVGEAA